jgi:ubiquinone/menaquinone biosynthesis C-methylase UbiE
MILPKDADYFLELQTQTGWVRMLASFARWCSPEPGQRILDVGTGPGLLPALFAREGAMASGVDLEIAMLADPLHPDFAVADASALPFEYNTFEIVTASNLLFLRDDPLQHLVEMARVAANKVCLLNPSEQMSVEAAISLADEKNLTGLARETLINLARRAEAHFRWSEADLVSILSQAGLTLTDTTLRMGGGLIRYACGQKFNV